ncbi:MAG: endonuclease MutS2 [Balneolaceae bacterium]|nr:endonuclease MutS2 [Balneolaceae bacterium]
MFIYPERLPEKIGFDQVRSAVVQRARSVTARERLAKLSPSSDPERIERRLEQCREMMRLLANDAAFPLDNLHDVRDWLGQASAEESMIPADAFQEIRELSVTARRVKGFLSDRRENYPLLDELGTRLIPLRKMEEAIAKVISENGEIRSDASSQLQSIRKRLGNKRNELRTVINRAMSRAQKEGMASDEGPTIRGGRMVIPIQAEYKRKIQGFVHDVSSSGQTVYLEPVEALNINNEIRSLESEEKRELERILRELTGTVRRHGDKIAQNLEALTDFDIVAAKGRLGNELDAYIPVVGKEERLYLREAYNPILKLKNLGLKEEEREQVVPLDLELNAEERCLIITGPNAGGKSVAMKTLGLCAMMVQSGLAIPARDSSEVPVYGSLLVDMGDDQSIENDLSTFSSRLEWMRTATEHCDERSLVLIDEAAAGTDPEEGGALFRALIEELIERRSRVLVTTHHGSLKVFAHEHPGAVNGSMEFDQETLSPTYRFRKGIPGSSYAFEIAERMNLDGGLLKRARVLLGEAKSDMESLIAELESRAQEADELKKKYDALKTKTESERQRYEEKRSAIEKEKEKIREKALKQASEIMETANRRIEEAVERIVEKGEKDDEAIREARRQVEEEKEDIARQLGELEEEKREHRHRDSGESPETGDTVRLEDAETTGELVELDGNRAVVQTGGLRLKTDYRKLVKVEEAASAKKKKKKVTLTGRHRPEPVSPSLEVRGMRGDEAVQKVMRHIDKAVASGMHRIDIIHGKGEGILRKLIHEHLDQRGDIERYEEAPLQQGGSGCTIVHL